MVAVDIDSVTFPLKYSPLTQRKGMQYAWEEPPPTLNVNPSSLNPSHPDFDGDELAGDSFWLHTSQGSPITSPPPFIWTLFK